MTLSVKAKAKLKVKLGAWKYVLLTSLLSLIQIKAKAQLCSSISPNTRQSYQKTYKEDPVLFLDLILSKFYQEGTRPNTLIKWSFDMSYLIKSLHQIYPSRVVKQKTFDHMSTLFFGGLSHMHHKVKHIKLAPSPKQKHKNKNAHTIWVQHLSPEQHCGKPHTAPITKFYLRHTQKYGFKILGAEIENKPTLSHSIELIKKLKKRGYSGRGVLSQLKLLSGSKAGFKLPKSIPSSQLLLTKFKTPDQEDTDRLPASL